MDFRKVLALRGPNVWSTLPVLEVWADFRDADRRMSDEIPGFDERLLRWLPTLGDRGCSSGEPSTFAKCLRGGTHLADVLAHVVLELQSLAGTAVRFGATRPTTEDGVTRLAVQFVDETLARECLEVGRRFVLAAAQDAPLDPAAETERLRDLCQDVCLGPSTRGIVEAAARRGIPWRRLNTASLIQFGHGAHQRRIMAAETDRTGAIAESIAQDKDLTRRLLAECGIPVPEGRSVESAEDAWVAAEEIGLPVVVKPQDGNQGRGVATNLQTREQVLAAYAAARNEGRRIIVEKFAPGFDYRLLVVGERVVAAARRDPAQVVGDGVHTVRELIDQVNTDPRRGEHHGTVLSRIHVDEVAAAVLADQGLDQDAVPAAGRTVLIRRNANLSTGGTAVDVTEQVHPSVRRSAVDAARIVGLDIAGIDVVACDVAQPLETQGGVIVEVNAAPGLRMHIAPSSGAPRPVGDAIVELLYPQGDGRIPIVAVTGVNGKTTTTRFIAHLLEGTGRCVGLTSTDGIYVDGRRIDSGDCSGPKSARAVLANPRVEAAVFETARGGILREGLGFDRCDVAVVTNIGEGDHLGLSDVDTLDKLARVKRTIVDAVGPQGSAVLNAADPHVAAMAEHCPGRVVFFGIDETLPAIVAHRKSGGRALFVRDGRIVLAEGTDEFEFVRLDRVPLTHGGTVRFQVENTLAAVGAGWALGLSLDMLATRVDNFSANLEQSPGRFNVFDVQGTTVVLDYGHNSSALLALIDALSRFPHERRTVVYSTAGDRRDCDIVRQGELLGAAFDRVILYEDHYKRGRRDGEIMALFRQGIAKSARATIVEDVHGAVASVEHAFRTKRAGELLVVQPDVVDETVDFLRRYLHELAQAEQTAVGERVAEAAPVSARHL